MRLLILVNAFLFVQLYVVSDAIRNSGYKRPEVEVGKNISICTDDEAEVWMNDFHNCFVDRKVKDGGTDLNNIVDRILDHSKDCIINSTKECRPDHGGFKVIICEVIKEMKDFCFMYLEAIFHGRNKVKDLDCVENILLPKTYIKCFKEVLNNTIDKSQEAFKKEVENAITCTNEVNKKCSKEAKTDLNQMVRDILHVEQPARENFKEDPKPKSSPPPMRWYDYVFQPFVSFWKMIKSWFG